VSRITAVRMRAERGQLAISLIDDPASLRLLPEE
jgi:hypothetical protein